MKQRLNIIIIKAAMSCKNPKNPPVLKSVCVCSSFTLISVRTLLWGQMMSNIKIPASSLSGPNVMNTGTFT